MSAVLTAEREREREREREERERRERERRERDLFCRERTVSFEDADYC
jgi:hypothetical protein